MPLLGPTAWAMMQADASPWRHAAPQVVGRVVNTVSDGGAGT